MGNSKGGELQGWGTPRVGNSKGGELQGWGTPRVGNSKGGELQVSKGGPDVGGDAPSLMVDVGMLIIGMFKATPSANHLGSIRGNQVNR